MRCGELNTIYIVYTLWGDGNVLKEAERYQATAQCERSDRWRVCRVTDRGAAVVVKLVVVPALELMAMCGYAAAAAAAGWESDRASIPRTIR